MNNELRVLKACEQAIHEYFGYKEEWRIYPIANYLHYFWIIDGGNLLFSEVRFDIKTKRGYFDHWIVRNKIFRKEDYTAAIVDTQTDMNIFFVILDNSKELK